MQTKLSNVPSYKQLDRATRLYLAGACFPDFYEAFVQELTPEGIWLAWCAGVTALRMESKCKSLGI